MRENEQGNTHRYGGLGNARETAYEIIRDKIINLELKPGEPLNDRLLAEEMNMSRTPVREALIILSTANMVVLKPQIGTFVALIDLERTEMEQFARYTVEKEIISQACRCASEETQWRYEENIRAHQHYADSVDADRGRILLKLDNAFHKIAFETVGRRKNFFYMLKGMQHIERLRALSVSRLNQDTNIKDHREISCAIIDGNQEQALLWLERHLKRYQEDMRELQKMYPEYFA